MENQAPVKATSSKASSLKVPAGRVPPAMQSFPGRARVQNALHETLEAPVQRKCDECEAEGAQEETPGIQPKLKVGAANDKFEQEADQTAERVMRMADPGVFKKPEGKSGKGRPAHRLTHTVQQGGADAGPDVRKETAQVKQSTAPRILRQSFDQPVVKEGEGDFLYEQYPDGTIVILRSPDGKGVGAKLPRGNRFNDAITNEIGPYYGYLNVSFGELPEQINEIKKPEGPNILPPPSYILEFLGPSVVDNNTGPNIEAQIKRDEFMAIYNSPEAKKARAIQKSIEQGGGTLSRPISKYLPQETQALLRAKYQFEADMNNPDYSPEIKASLRFNYFLLKLSFLNPSGRGRPRLTPKLPPGTRINPKGRVIETKTGRYKKGFRKYNINEINNPVYFTPEDRIQPKLKVGAANDKFEQEADQTAERVMRMADPGNFKAQVSPENNQVQAKGAPGGSVSNKVSNSIKGLRGGGTPLPKSSKAFFEPRFGHDFSKVRLHTGAKAAKMADSIQAKAFTLGNDIAFAKGAYNPESQSGKQLLAHELTHTVQQGGKQNRSVRKQPAYGVPSPDTRGVLEEKPRFLLVPPKIKEKESTAIRKDEESPKAQEGTEGEPNLELRPGEKIKRGETLTAQINFSSNAKTNFKITAWEYHTANYGTFSRPVEGQDFQSKWEGPMVVSGEIEITFQKAQGTTELGPKKKLKKSITVNDRIGPPWKSQVDEKGEVPYAGQPSPAEYINQLGVHEKTSNNKISSTLINKGPNLGFSFVTTVNSPSFISLPKIHPDLTNKESDFYKFHLKPSRLYFEVGAKRTLIPPKEYSNLNTANGKLTFDVSNWEAFYKKYKCFNATVTGGGKTISLKDAWWGLASNSRKPKMKFTDEQAIWKALPSNAKTFSASLKFRGVWDGYKLMPASEILKGTRSHEYKHPVHSHRANLLAMVRALNPNKKIENKVSPPGVQANFMKILENWNKEIFKPYHELVDEIESKKQEKFIAKQGQTMAGVNVNPTTGDNLGTLWNITKEEPLKNKPEKK